MTVPKPLQPAILRSIPLVGRYLHYYFVFRRWAGDRALFLGLISVFSTLTEGAGIAGFLAYVQFLAAGQQIPSGAITKIQSLFQKVGLGFTPTRVLPVLVLIFALRSLLVFLGKGYHFRLYTRIVIRMNQDLSRALAKMRYSEYLKHNSGFFTHLATTEVSRSITAFYQVSAIIPVVISVATYILLSLRVDWRFTVLAAFFGLGSTALLKAVMTRTAKASRELSSAQAKMSSLMIQLLQAYKYLFSTDSLEPLQLQIAESANRMGVEGSRIGFLGAIVPASSETVIVAFMATMVYLQTQVFDRPLEPVVVSMLFLYRAMRETTTLQGSWQAFNQYVGGVDNLVNTIDELSASSEPPGGKAFTSIHDAIRLDDVSFAYGNNDVLRNLKFDIEANSMVAFVGESGAGKSTLVDLLTGLLPPTRGTLSIDGTSYRELDRDSLRSRIGYVTQDSVVFDDTVLNNVSLWQWQKVPDGRERVREALRRAECLSFVEQLPRGLEEIVGERGIRLSGGQRQRLSIARELYKSPALLILDEATSALDSESERSVQQSIDAQKGSTTIVMIAHRLATVKNCDRIFVLEKGRLIESGTFAELRAREGYFRRMCAAQSLE